MTRDCGVRGAARAVLMDNRAVWQRADDRVHVSRELADSHSPDLLAMYEIGEWCEREQAFHATRIAPNPTDRLTTTQVAELLNIQPATWRAYVSRKQAPAPDGHHDKRTPYWLRGTIEGMGK